MHVRDDSVDFRLSEEVYFQFSLLCSVVPSQVTGHSSDLRTQTGKGNAKLVSFVCMCAESPKWLLENLFQLFIVILFHQASMKLKTPCGVLTSVDFYINYRPKCSHPTSSSSSCPSFARCFSLSLCHPELGSVR